MTDSVTIEEQAQPIIKIGTLVAAILSVVFFVVFWQIKNPFWISIFRFSSFIFFAITVFGYLRLMNKPLTITLESSEEHLKVIYRKENKIIQHEEFDRSTIKNISFSQSGRFITSFLQPDSATLRISFTDTPKKLYLFEFGGRPLFFRAEALDKIRNFLQQVDIKT